MSCEINEGILEGILSDVEELSPVEIVNELGMDIPQLLIDSLDIEAMQYKLAYQRFENLSE